MNAALPVVFASDEARLLTALVIGGAFGFALERGGFGNARKLAAQFYLHDMTVLKVMFTAIVVAMTGVYVLGGLGLVDVSRVFIPETFIWAQLAGGFLLGLGFIVSGLCPGTALVSAASGRLDAVAVLVGVFGGTWLFGAVVDWFPGLSAFWSSGSLGVSTLPALLGIPAWVVVLLVIAMAVGAFMLAERVEPAFQKRHRVVELTPVTRPPYKFALASVLALVVVVGTAARRASPPPAAVPMGAMAPMTLAERIIARDPLLVILDVRGAPAGPTIPGTVAAATDSAARAVLSGLAPGATVVVYDSAGTLRDRPGAWPGELTYLYVSGGYAGWHHEVLVPAVPASPSLAERDRVQHQNQLAAFFSGAAVQAATAPPPAPTGGGSPAKKKKPGGGC